MAGYSHCIECGRRLRNAFFCRDCPEAACSQDCLDKHRDHHAPAPDAMPRPQEDDPNRPGQSQSQGHAPTRASAGAPQRTNPRAGNMRNSPPPR